MQSLFCFKVPIIFYKTQQGLLALWFYIRYDSIMMPTKEQAMALLENGKIIRLSPLNVRIKLQVAVRT